MRSSVLLRPLNLSMAVPGGSLAAQVEIADHVPQVGLCQLGDGEDEVPNVVWSFTGSVAS